LTRLESELGVKPKRTFIAIGKIKYPNVAPRAKNGVAKTRKRSEKRR
jgi:hypothetical protein